MAMFSNRLFSLLPCVCVLCGGPVGAERICSHCLACLPWLEVACARCAVPLGNGSTCGSCQSRPPYFSAARARFHYAFPVDSALKRVKFGGKLSAAPAFAELLAPLVEETFRDCDALVPVPLHRWRQLRRGFNQAQEIARPLGKICKIPISYAAVRARSTLTQSGLSAPARRQNLRNAFAVSGPLNARHPLIVDDVMTTGTTCNELARVLLLAGAKSVGVLTVARAAK